MDNSQEIQKQFLDYLQGIISQDGQPFSFESSVSKTEEEAEKCLKKAKSVANENLVVASEYYCLASFICLIYLTNSGHVDSIFDKGSNAAKKAAEILPEDYEYLIFTLFYRIESINVEKSGAKQAFAVLQEIHRKCPPFHIISNSIFNPEWLEDFYNDQFESKLQAVLCSMLDDDEEEAVAAALLLKTFPAPFSKLLAFTALSQNYFSQGKDDEALRNAKLGVEVLGNNFDYDYHNFSHTLWGECWTLVGVISRKQGNFDFAESVFEKGARLGIIPCMLSLAELHENGECDDPDPKSAIHYRDLANETQRLRDKEKEEEEERIRQEEEERIRQEEEEARKAREQEAIKKEISRKKSILWTGVASLTIAILAGIIYLCNENILDKLAKCQKAGMAILSFQKDGQSPNIISMNQQGIYYLDEKKTYQILSFQSYIQDVVFGKDNYGGLSVQTRPSGRKLTISSSRDCHIVRLSSQSFLLSTKIIPHNLLSRHSISLNDCYLIVRSADSKKSGIIQIPPCQTDGYGHLNWELSGNITSLYEKDFRSSYPKDIYNRIVAEQYGHFVATISFSLTDGDATIINKVDFDKLGRSYYSGEVGTDTHKKELRYEISKFFRDELTHSFLENACQKTGVYNKSLMRVSPSLEYTFVIVYNYYGGRDRHALFRVNNYTKDTSIIDSGMDIEFEPNQIWVKKYSTFLLFFDSYDNVYYSYEGMKL